MRNSVLFGHRVFLIGKPMESESITLVVDYTVKDLRVFIYKGAMTWMVIEAIYIFVLFFIVFVVASHYMVGPLSETFRNSALAFLLLAPVSIFVMNLVSLERLARRRAGARKNPVTLELTETGITANEPHKTATLEWPAYKRAVDSKDRIIV